MCCLLTRVRLSGTPWTVARQAPLSLGFSREECWNGWPLPSPGDLPSPGVEPRSPASQERLSLNHQRSLEHLASSPLARSLSANILAPRSPHKLPGEGPETVPATVQELPQPRLRQGLEQSLTVMNQSQSLRNRVLHRQPHNKLRGSSA